MSGSEAINGVQRAKTIKKCREKVGYAKAHWWQITFPDGHVEVIKNLRAFCREHGLSQGNMHAVATGRKKSCKGFGCNKKR